MSEYIKSSAAVKLFVDAGLSESTFRRYVREEKIRVKKIEGRERGMLYSSDDIHVIIQQKRKNEAKKVETKQQNVQIGETDWINESDLPFILAYDLEMYGIENTVDISITNAWWKKNNRMCRILFDKNDRRNIWGVITVMPMEEKTITKLLKSEMEEKDITPDDILTYELGGRYNAYIASAAVRPEHRNYIRTLINEMLQFWCDMYPQVQLTKLYAFAATDEGYNLIRHLYFSPRYDIGEDAFELDPYRMNPSPVITLFQRCITRKQENKEKANEP